MAASVSPDAVRVLLASMAVRLDVTHEDPHSRARAGILHTPHGSVETPYFCVVGTAATVKGVTPAQLRELGAEVLLANTYHLYLRPGHETIRTLGGLHRVMGWDGPIVTDSGGFQVFSLGYGLEHGVGKQVGMFPEEGEEKVRPTGKPPAQKLMRVDDEGVSFVSHIDGSRQRFTPESSIAVQEALGADVILAFDEPTSPLHDEAYTAAAMARTHAWAERCLDARTRADQALYGIVQGGAYEVPRRKSAGVIASLPFDGVAIGGSLGKSKADMHAVLDWSVPALPAHWPRHMLGIGEPEDLFACIRGGVDQLDCVTPTRLARHGQVYTHRGKINLPNLEHRENTAPIEEGCPCYTCRTGFSRGTLRHLFNAKELLAYTLASIHNLQFILGLVKQIRTAIVDGRLEEFEQEFLARYSAGAADEPAGGDFAS